VFALLLQLAIRAALLVDITTDYPFYRLSAPLCMAILQPTILCIRNEMSGDTTNDYLLSSTMSRDSTTDHLRCSTSLASLQLTIRSALPVDITTDYPLYRLSAMLEFCRFSLAFGSPISFSYMDWGSIQLELCVSSTDMQVDSSNGY
jgi:hypothetical protein